MTISPRRFRKIVLALLILYWATMLTITHLPPGEPPKIKNIDKAEHFVAYGLLAGLLHLSLWPRRWSAWRLGITVLIVVSAYGAFDELSQPYFRRTCDIRDWTADTIGALIAIGVMSIAYRLTQRRLTENTSGQIADSV